MGKVFPAMFKESYWYPNFSCTVKESMDNQLTLINKKVNAEHPLMMYINIDTIHYPNHFYIENAKPGDTVEITPLPCIILMRESKNFSISFGKPGGRR